MLSVAEETDCVECYYAEQGETGDSISSSSHQMHPEREFREESSLVVLVVPDPVLNGNLAAATNSPEEEALPLAVHW